MVGRICSNRELSASSKEIATVIKKSGLIKKCLRKKEISYFLVQSAEENIRMEPTEKS